MKKYTFIEFIAAIESASFDKIDPSWLKWAHKFMDNVDFNSIHGGDCTKQSYPCSLCTVETWLNDYHEWTFNPEKWRHESGI